VQKQLVPTPSKNYHFGVTYVTSKMDMMIVGMGLTLQNLNGSINKTVNIASIFP
jgi:hypothetical protein